MESIVGIIFLLLALYLIAGFVFYILLLRKGMKAMDEAAEGVKLGFKLLILPGTLFLWPFLWATWKKSSN